MLVLVAGVMGLSAVCKEVIGAQIPMFPQVDILLPQTEFLARGGTWIIFGWVGAARDSKLAPRSKKHFP